ncbi:MAG: tetratricopeptide repeat protein [Bacteroidales bacterium]|nr:tetratricopeptide repeat protein [Bacteroidales bacterium]
MKRLDIAIVCLLALTAAGCGGAKKSAMAESESPYKRKPLTEVSEQTLKVDGMIIDAKTQQSIGNETEAERLYQAVLELDSTNAEANYELARMMFQRGWFDSAAGHATIAWQSNQANPWYALLLSEIYKHQGNTKQLIALWEEMTKIAPDELNYYNELSNAYVLAGNINSAVEALNRVERKIGITEGISLQKQKIWTYAGRNDKAIKEVENLAAAVPQEKRYQAILSELYIAQGKPEKARRCYERIAEIDPDDEYVHISLASYYKQAGNMDRAYDELKQGLRSSAIDNKSKLQILGSFYTSDEFYGKYSKQAFALLEQLMAECDDTVTYATFYGDVLMRQERYAEAARQFRASLTADSSQYPVWEALLICENEIPNNDVRLLNLARRAQKLFPLHILPYFIEGQTLVNQQQYEQAIGPLKQCESIGFTNGYLADGCYSLMAECYYRTGRYSDAWATFDRCLAITGDNIGVLNNYAYYLAEQSTRLADAERMSKKTIDAEPDNATFLDTYAWVLHCMGRNNEALKYMERAVAADKRQSQTLIDHLNTIKKAAQQ